MNISGFGASSKINSPADIDNFMLKIFKLNIIIISEFSIFLLSTLYWLKIQFSLDVLDVYLMDPESKFWQNLISMICMKTAAGCCWAGHCTGTNCTNYQLPSAQSPRHHMVSSRCDTPCYIHLKLHSKVFIDVIFKY